MVYKFFDKNSKDTDTFVTCTVNTFATCADTASGGTVTHTATFKEQRVDNSAIKNESLSKQQLPQ